MMRVFVAWSSRMRIGQNRVFQTTLMRDHLVRDDHVVTADSQFRAMVRGDDLLHVPRWWRLALVLARNAPEWLVKRSKTEERFAAQLPGSEE